MKLDIKQKLCILLKLFVFGILLLCSLFVVSKIMLPKWNDGNCTKNIKGFYNLDDNTLDLMFVGSSDIANGVCPMELYNNTGITSYIHSSQGQRIWTSYYMLKSDLKYQSPQVVILNVDGCLTNKDEKDANVQKFLNLTKWDTTKFEAITDKVYKGSVNDVISYIFPVFRYHNRYSELEPKDLLRAFTRYHSVTKGQNTNFKIDPHKSGYKYMRDKGDTIEFTDTQRSYFDKIVDMCNDKNIKLVLMELPSGDSWNLAKSQCVTKYAKEKGLDFIDFNLIGDDIGFDWKTDTIDHGDHLNVNGAEKITAYLQKYLADNFKLPDHRGQANYKEWDSDGVKYANTLEKKKAHFQELLKKKSQSSKTK